jgi:acetolactate synthase I/II/III large subunit
MAQITAGAALMSRLKDLGVDVVFANSGTDFPPIIEGIAEAKAKGMPLPQTLVMPVESAAMGMAHGYYLATGRAQAVMVHTNVGLANTTLGAINAACEQVPLLLIGGRTPVLEKGRFGARTVPIGWGQEMLDQAGLVREACKWDYELRFPEQIFDVLDRAYGIATSLPRGPVYVSLPREVLCESIPADGGTRRPQMRASISAARPEDVERAADLLAGAEHPVIFAQRGAGSDVAFAALGELAQEWGISVCQYWATQLAVPTDHPMAAGPDAKDLLETADVVLVINALAPWAPGVCEPREEAQVIQLGPDPLQSRTGVRNFRSDLSLTGEVAPAILALKAALDTRLSTRRTRNEKRTKAVARTNAKDRAARIARAQADREKPQLSKAWVSHTLAEMLDGTGAAVFNELGLQLPFMRLDHPKAWFDGPLSGGLGWGLPAALGFKLAEPERPVIAAMGDGSYIFANPVACHQIAEALGLSVVVIVMNNAEWAAVRHSVVGLYPDGHAARGNSVPLTGLEPSPDFVRVAQASRAWARRVATADEFETALTEALAHTNAKQGLALIEVTIGRD